MKHLNKIFFCLIILSAALVSDSYAFIDDIHLGNITDMKLRKNNETYSADVTMIFRNSSNKDLKLKDCRFDLSFALKNSETIRIGTVIKDEIILTKSVNSSPSKQNVFLSANIGNDIRKLHLAIISSDEMNALLTDPAPKLTLRIVGGFDAGMKSDLGWTYQKGLKINWLITSEVPRKALIRTYKAIENSADKEEAGEQVVLADNEEDTSLSDVRLTIYFSKGQKILSDKNKKDLQDWLKNLPAISEGWLLNIDGHTDKDGYLKNKDISEQRAMLVRDHLFSISEFSPNRVKIFGYGEEKPVMVGKTREANDKNRRVELYFIKP